MVDPDVPDKNKSESESKKTLKPEELKNLSSRQYLDDYIVPVLLKAITSANQKRPSDPIEYIGNYLLKHSEDKKTSKETSSTTSSTS
uniref:Protein dpy-30 homolog n=1 Tax=Lepeophtheirus salmonis TaxID=72036 RepID=D3PJ16_LEPSM|nr:Protein dpy-30 homolog [Lepeophtheirus salmonis]